ncbi:MAG: NADP-dependent oxidoreductase [Coxiellaceae bacterium]|nr:NADP-dependent oxidoreductase [Coxiellaceae bacterium]
MKAMAIEAFGDVDSIKQIDIEKPQPASDEVLIKIDYAGVNPVDWKICQGAIKDLLPHHFPLVLGWDAAGTIEMLGDAVANYQVGDKVYAYCRKDSVQQGTYAEYVAVDTNAIAKVPSNITLEQASGIPLVALTAWQSLFDFADLQSGQTILIHAGAGGVGSIAIQLAKWRGAKVYATASEANHEYVKGLGADRVIDYNAHDFVDVLKQHESQGVDVVYDTVGGDTQVRSFDLLKKGGALVSIVAPPAEDVAAKYEVKSGFVFVAPNSQQLQKISQLIEQGIVKPVNTQSLPLEQAAVALQKNLERHVRGKLVLAV